MKFNLFCSLDEDIWQARIHFDAREPLEMKLCGSDITYLNLVAVMETQGFNAYDCLYHIENPSLGEKGLDLVDSHAELQKIKRKIQDKLVLDLLVRACPPLLLILSCSNVKCQSCPLWCTKSLLFSI